MPKRHRHRGGDMFGNPDSQSATDTLSGYLDSAKQGAQNLWEKTKGAVGMQSQPSYAPTAYGGKSKRRRMRGGFKDNTPTTGIAANAASFSGNTAQAHNWVGGKTRKRRHHRSKKHRHTKSCKHRKH